MPIDSGESHEIVDNLRLRLTNGEGKLVYDSIKDKPAIGYPTDPLKFCPNCGGGIQPVIYMCKCCSTRFVQTEDLKTHRKIVMTLPLNEEP